MVKNLTAVIVVRDEEENLRRLLPTLKWTASVLVVDHGSKDSSARVAKQLGARVVKCQTDSFATLRTQALKDVNTDWVFYLDADERVPASLRQEIKTTLARAPGGLTALTLRRRNFCYGQELQHGGWQHDRLARIFRLRNFRGWRGVIHESPIFTGVSRDLKAPLWHFTHRDTAANLLKSSAWTIKEAQLLAASSATPQVTGRLILRKIFMEFYRRYWRDGGRRDGIVGLIESLTQAWNRGFVYIQVWELQQQPSLPERYAKLEKKVAKAE